MASEIKQLAITLLDHAEAGSVAAQFAWEDLLDAIGRANAWTLLTDVIAERNKFDRSAASATARATIAQIYCLPVV